jgi:hypothetical protein
MWLVLFSTCSASGAESLAYSVDGVALGSSLSDLIASRGEPRASGDNTYTWAEPAGRELTVVTLANGVTVLIDVRVGKGETGRLQLPAEPPQTSIGLVGSSHINYNPPSEATHVDECGPSLKGMPCEALTLPQGAELIVNFGKDIGMMDGLVSEVILGNRDLLLQRGQIIRRISMKTATATSR